jgi:probable HAF family extracellular repeat protein
MRTGKTITIAGFIAGLAVLAARSTLAGPSLTGDLAPSRAAGKQTSPQVSRGANGYLVVWSDVRSALSAAAGLSSYVGTGLGTMWDVYAARLDGGGGLIDAVPIIVSEAPYHQTAPVVGWNGQNWLVVWMTERGTDRYRHDVMAARVAPDGRVLDDPPIMVNPAGTSINLYTPWSVSSDGTNWVVVWRGVDDLEGIFTIDGARVSPDGTVLDAGGKRLRHDTWNSAPTSADLAFAGDMHLLTWLELDPVRIDWVVRGQRLTLGLDPIGAPFTINLYEPSSPNAPRVASDGSGFLVVWSENRYYAAAQLFGARVSHTGQVLDPDGIPITDHAFYTRFAPDVCWDGADYVVGYNKGGADLDDDIFATRVSSGGAVLDPAGFLVKGGAATQSQAAVAPRAGGGVQAVWTDAEAGGPDSLDIETAQVSPSGTARTSISVSRGLPRQSRPRMATNGSGHLIVFKSEVSGTSRILAQRIDASGNELDPEPTAIASGPGNLTNPSVAWNGSVFLVVWQDSSANGSRGQVYGRRLLPDGTLPDGGPIAVMPGLRPDVAALGPTFLVVADDAPTNPHLRAVFSTRVTSGAVVLDAPTPIGPSFDGSARVAALGARWLVVWESHPSHDDPAAAIMGEFVGPDGRATSPFFVSDGGYDYTPHLAVAGGSALVVWAEGDIFGRPILADGTLLGAASGIVISNAPNGQFDPAVSWDGAQYVVDWIDQRNDTYPAQPRGDIYGARIDAGGNLLDPVGFAVANSPLPEETPTVAATGGRAIFAYAEFFDSAPYNAVRIALRRFPFDLDYSLSVSPPGQTVQPGDSVSYVVSVAPVGGFAGTVTFNAFGLPPGASASFSPLSVTGAGSTTLTVTVGTRAPEEVHRLTVVGWSGAQRSTAQAALAVATNPVAARFTVTDVGTLGGGTYSEAWAINNSGEVAGHSNLAGGPRRAFLFSGGVLTDLGTLGGTESGARAINDAGQIAGWAKTSVGSTHAFLRTAGAMQDLGTFGSATDDSDAYGINDAGQVAGWAELGMGAGPHAFLYGAGSKQDLGALGGYWSYAFGVNTSGQVAGVASDASGSARAFLWSGGVMRDLGALAGGTSDSYAYDLDDAGRVVGASTYMSSQSTHAVLFSGGALTDLGTLGGTESAARAINGSGQIVGHSTNASAVTRAFLHEHGAMLNLNNLVPAGSGWDLTEAYDINDAGQIVGKGSINGQTHGFLLTPTVRPGDCSYAISPSSAIVGAGGGAGSVEVTAPADCGWTASSDSGWLVVTSGGSGTGIGVVGYSVASEALTAVRTGTLTIAGAPFVVSQGDSDGDGASDAADCAPLDAAAYATPGEVTGLRFDSDRTTITWSTATVGSGAGTVHDLLRGVVRELPAGSGALETCTPGIPAATTQDISTPPVGEAFWYLVRGRNACGAGTYGSRSDGVERTSATCP